MPTFADSKKITEHQLPDNFKQIAMPAYLEPYQAFKYGLEAATATAARQAMDLKRSNTELLNAIRRSEKEKRDERNRATKQDFRNRVALASQTSLVTGLTTQNQQLVEENATKTLMLEKILEQNEQLQKQNKALEARVKGLEENLLYAIQTIFTQISLANQRITRLVEIVERNATRTHSIEKHLKQDDAVQARVSTSEDRGLYASRIYFHQNTSAAHKITRPDGIVKATL